MSDAPAAALPPMGRFTVPPDHPSLPGRVP